MSTDSRSTPTTPRPVVLATIAPLLLGNAAARSSLVGETKAAVARRACEDVFFPQVEAAGADDAGKLSGWRDRVQLNPVAVAAEVAAYLALEVTYETHEVIPALDETSSIFEYIFTVRVLLDRDGYDPDSLADIGHEIVVGDGTGSWERNSVRRLTFTEALEACAEVGSDMGFFGLCESCARDQEACIC